MKKSTSLTAMAVLFCLGSVVLSGLLGCNKATEKIQSALNRDKALMVSVMNAGFNGDNEISYGEFFAFCDAAVNERTKLLADFAEIDNGKPNKLRDSVISFFNAENKMLREKRRFFSQTMEMMGENENAALSFRPNLNPDWVGGVADHLLTYAIVVDKEEDIARQVKRSGGSYLCHYRSYKGKIDYLTNVYSDFAREMGVE